jgi:hypothetical protein
VLLVVSASRTWNSWDAIRECFDEVWALASREHGARYPNEVKLLHGDARGGDQMCRATAELFGFTVEPMAADWQVKDDTPQWAIQRRADGSSYDVRAGRQRNDAMLARGPNVVAVFQRDGSPGTRHVIGRCEELSLPLMLWRQEGMFPYRVT